MTAGAKLGTAGPLHGYTTVFATFDLRRLIAVVNDPSVRGDRAHLRMPSSATALAVCSAQPGWADLDARAQAAQVERERQRQLQDVATLVYERLFRPGRAPRVPHGGRLCQLLSDGITGTGTHAARTCTGV